MSLDTGGRAIAGVDGCKAGWVAWLREPDDSLTVRTFPDMATLVANLPGDAVIAVDMPIGLPDGTGQGGRGTERLVRPLLGQRQSSVFSIPSRAAVWAETAPFTTLEAWYDAHRRASEVARATSDPPRGVSIQAFGIFPKIREIDELLLQRPDLRQCIFESHPEVAFWRLNGERAMRLPKKIGGIVNPTGMAERKELLVRHGIPRDLLDRGPPPRTGEDDVLDAAAMLLIAARIARGEARPFPDPPDADSHGIPIAIRA